MINQQKIIILIGAVVVVGVILGVGGYFAYQQLTAKSQSTSQAEETAGWNTYKNDGQGYEFKYPKEWVVSYNTAESSVNVWSSEDKKKQSESSEAKVPVYPEFSVALVDTGTEFLKDGETIIDGQKAYPSISKGYHIHIPQPKGIFILSAKYSSSQDGPFDPENPNIDKNVQKIIATFKFANNQQIVGGDKNNLTEGWKIYTDQQISFKYPAGWNQVRKNNLLGFEGNYFVGDNYANEPINIGAYSAGTKLLEQTIFNNKQVNINWTAEQFAQNMGFSSRNVLFTKKLGNKSMLVAVYENYECSPGIIVSVLTPFNSSFPNVDFRVWKLGENKDVKNLIDKHNADYSAGKADPCDWYDIIKAEADKIYNGTYSAEASQNIKTATQMAESIISK